MKPRHELIVQEERNGLYSTYHVWVIGDGLKSLLDLLPREGGIYRIGRVRIGGERKSIAYWQGRVSRLKQALASDKLGLLSAGLLTIGSLLIPFFQVPSTLMIALSPILMYLYFKYGNEYGWFSRAKQLASFYESIDSVGRVRKFLRENHSCVREAKAGDLTKMLSYLQRSDEELESLLS
jgi:hypothetical protein